jgi:hypothetical protein
MTKPQAVSDVRPMARATRVRHRADRLGQQGRRNRVLSRVKHNHLNCSEQVSKGS